MTWYRYTTIFQCSIFFADVRLSGIWKKSTKDITGDKFSSAIYWKEQEWKRYVIALFWGKRVENGPKTVKVLDMNCEYSDHYWRNSIDYSYFYEITWWYWDQWWVTKLNSVHFWIWSKQLLAGISTLQPIFRFNFLTRRLIEIHQQDRVSL